MLTYSGDFMLKICLGKEGENNKFIIYSKHCFTQQKCDFESKLHILYQTMIRMKKKKVLVWLFYSQS